MNRTARPLAAAALLALVLTACADDGGSVQQPGKGSGSGSGSVETTTPSPSTTSSGTSSPTSSGS